MSNSKQKLKTKSKMILLNPKQNSSSFSASPVRNQDAVQNILKTGSMLPPTTTPLPNNNSKQQSPQHKLSYAQQSAITGRKNNTYNQKWVATSIVSPNAKTAATATATAGGAVIPKAANEKPSNFPTKEQIKLFKQVARSKNEEAIEDLRTSIPEIDNIFDIHGRIGHGTFSTVLLGTLKKERELSNDMRRKFAIKHHVPTNHPERIIKELHCMAKIGGSDNVIGINCCIRYNESVAFIMPYMAHDRFHDFFDKMDVKEVQNYMMNLLVALKHVHRFNVIHRDVKPSNFLYNRKKRQFLLVDFGLAQQVPHKYQSAFAPIQTSTDDQKAILQSPYNSDKKFPRQKGGREDNIESDKSAMLMDQSYHKNKPIRYPEAANNNNEIFDAAGSSLRQIKLKTNDTGHNSSAQRIKRPQNVMDNSNTLQASPLVGAVTNAIDIKSNPTNELTQNFTNKCICQSQLQVFNRYPNKKEVHASRAGTPGFRPPEVLIKYPDQTTAVDIWAVGVILLSILSNVYPFFKAPNDYIALAEIVTLFGDGAIRNTAFLLDRLVILSQRTKPLDLRKLCIRFRNRAKFSSPEMLRKYQKPDGSCEICKNCDQYYFNCLCLHNKNVAVPLEDDGLFPDAAYDLLYKLLEVNPHKRISAEKALKHPFFKEMSTNSTKVNPTVKNERN